MFPVAHRLNRRSGSLPARCRKDARASLACMDPLASLGRALRERGYAFVTPTPETHRRVLARGAPARTLRDVFGWSKPFAPGVLPEDVLELLEAAGALLREGALLRSSVRFSSLGPLLLAHSAYPTTAADSVFFGPD